MPFYNCDKCGKSFPSPSKLERHNHRKNPCFSVGEEKTLQNPAKPCQDKLSKKHIQKKSTENPICNFICEYCNKSIKYQKNYKSHLRNSCEKISLSKKKLLLEKYNKNKNHTNNLTTITNYNTNNNKTNNTTNLNNEIINNNDIINNNEIINNNKITNNNNQNIQNNTQNINNTNNYAFNINPLGQENTDNITNEKAMEYLDGGVVGYCKFLRALYMINQNRNIYIKSKKDNIVQFINTDYQLDIGNLDEIISDITVLHHNKFDELFDKNQKHMTEQNKAKYQKVKQLFYDKQEKFERHTYLCLVNANEINKEYINKFLKIKNSNGEEQVLIRTLE